MDSGQAPVPGRAEAPGITTTTSGFGNLPIPTSRSGGIPGKPQENHFAPWAVARNLGKGRQREIREIREIVSVVVAFWRFGILSQASGFGCGRVLEFRAGGFPEGLSQLENHGHWDGVG